MALDTSFHDYIMSDVLGGISGVTSKSMFGGWGIYRDGIIFALIADAQLYFKVGPNNQAEYEAYGSEPFVYEHPSRKKPSTMPYWLVPEAVMEDRDLLPIWVDAAVAASVAAKKKK